jgi:hypothetical protein
MGRGGAVVIHARPLPQAEQVGRAAQGDELHQGNRVGALAFPEGRPRLRVETQHLKRGTTGVGAALARPAYYYGWPRPTSHTVPPTTAVHMQPHPHTAEHTCAVNKGRKGTRGGAVEPSPGSQPRTYRQLAELRAQLGSAARRCQRRPIDPPR